MLDQCRSRCADVVQMLYKCFVFAGNGIPYKQSIKVQTQLRKDLCVHWSESLNHRQVWVASVKITEQPCHYVTVIEQPDPIGPSRLFHFYNQSHTDSGKSYLDTDSDRPQGQYSGRKNSIIQLNIPGVLISRWDSLSCQVDKWKNK